MRRKFACEEDAIKESEFWLETHQNYRYKAFQKTFDPKPFLFKFIYKAIFWINHILMLIFGLNLFKIRFWIKPFLKRFTFYILDCRVEAEGGVERDW